MSQAEGNGGVSIRTEAKKLKRELTLLPLAGIIYFTVSGGTFGIEGLIGYSGPGLAMLMILLTPLIFSLPNVLLVRELTTLMPSEGGYYHWVKQAFGPFAGFMAGWNNWIVSWLDVAIYPVLAYYYLSFFFPALADGPTILNVPVWQIVISGIIIWGISYLQIRGASVSGWFTNGLGVLLIIPLFVMGFIGIYNWIVAGMSFDLPFLPMGEPVTLKSLGGALSVGLFIVMWNYMGWELPTAAGDEIVNPKKTYPLALTIVLIGVVLTYAIPVFGGLYGGGGANGSYLMWGTEAETDAGVGADLSANYGITEEQIQTWGADSTSTTGWEFPNIGQAVGTIFAGVGFGAFLGAWLTFAAVLSMVGLFTGNSLGGTRIPFALAEDGMFPRWMVRVHPKYGTPYIAIILTGLIYWFFASFDFSTLVVADVFLQLIVILAEFAALWVFRFKLPDAPRDRVPGGWFGLVLVTLGPVLIILVAIISQFIEVGWSSLGFALLFMLAGVLLYFPIIKYLKPGVPDVNPFVSGVDDE
ncbi:MAG: amino acid permease [Chloroflexi bacterium]|nr:amino acid permease [Chloroflexota bacterium]